MKTHPADVTAAAQPVGRCPTLEQLIRAASGEGSAKEQERVTRHVASCPLCARAWNAAGGAPAVVASMLSAPEASQPATPTQPAHMQFAPPALQPANAQPQQSTTRSPSTFAPAFAPSAAATFAPKTTPAVTASPYMPAAAPPPATTATSSFAPPSAVDPSLYAPAPVAPSPVAGPAQPARSAFDPQATQPVPATSRPAQAFSTEPFPVLYPVSLPPSSRAAASPAFSPPPVVRGPSAFDPILPPPPPAAKNASRNRTILIAMAVLGGVLLQLGLIVAMVARLTSAAGSPIRQITHSRTLQQVRGYVPSTTTGASPMSPSSISRALGSFRESLDTLHLMNLKAREALARPSGPPPILSLQPMDATAATDVASANGNGYFSVIVHLPPPPVSSVDLAGPDGRVIWSRAINPGQRTIKINFPARSLAPGLIRIRALDPSKSATAVYAFQVTGRG